MAQAASHWLITMRAQVHIWVSPWANCGRESGIRTGLPWSSLVFLSISFDSGSPYSYTTWEQAVGLLVAAIQRYSLIPSTWTISSLNIKVSLSAWFSKTSYVCSSLSVRCISQDYTINISICKFSFDALYKSFCLFSSHNNLYVLRN
jgi:hypothetical protein